MKHFFAATPSWFRRLCAPWLTWTLLLAGLLAKAQAPAWQQPVLVAPGPNSSNYSVLTKALPAADGGVYLVGYFLGTVSFGNISLTSAGLADVYVAKWSPAANDFVWAVRGGGTGNDYARSAASSGQQVYVSGDFSGTTVFGGSSFTAPGTGNTPNQGFVAKLADAGTSAAFLWGRHLDSSLTSGAAAVAVEGSSVYVTGAFSGSLIVGSSQLTHVGRGGAYVVKINDTGPFSSFVWARQFSSSQDIYPKTIGVRAGSVYLAGDNYGQALIGSTSLPSSGGVDMFVAKLADAGSSAAFTWAYGAGGSAIEYTYDLALSGSAVYLAGGFNSPTVTFGGTTP